MVTDKFPSEIFRDPVSPSLRDMLRPSIPDESKAVCFLHFHLKHKTTLTGGYVLVEVTGIEPVSESGCDCESTVCRTFFVLSA